MTDYEQLVKALRHCSHDGLVKCNECKYGGKEWPVGCEEELMKDAAAAIEELQAEIRESMQKCAECSKWNEPKRGEWIGVSPFVDSVQCSECGYCIHSEELETPYCPNCGAKMEETDADRID